MSSRRVALVVILYSLIFITGTLQLHGASSSALAAQIDTLVQKGEFSSAEDVCRKTLDRDSRNAEALFQLGRVYAYWAHNPGIDTGSAASSEHDHDHDHDPGSASTGVSIELLEKAVSHIREALLLEPDRNEYRLELMNIYNSTGAPDKVIEVYREARDHHMDGDMLREIAGFAQGYAAEGQFQHAVVLLKDLSRFDPTNASLKVSYAVSLMKTARPDEAREVLERAVKSGSMDGAVLENYLQILMLFRDFETAMSVSETALASRKTPQGLFDRAIILTALGRDEVLAWEVYLAAAKGLISEDRYRPLAKRLLEICTPATEDGVKGAGTNRSNDVMKLYQEFRKIGADHYAVAMLEVFGRVGGSELDYWEALFELYADLKLPGPEWIAFSRARELGVQKPDRKAFYEDRRVWFDLARNYFHSGMFDIAMDYFEKNIENGFDDAKVRFHMGRVHDSGGDPYRAAQLFREAEAREEPAVFRLKAKTWLGMPRFKNAVPLDPKAKEK